MCDQKRLACGGKGPCCHIGYAHRHCEHCDFVISLHTCQPYPWWNSPLGQPVFYQLGTTQTDTTTWSNDHPPLPKVFAMNSSVSPDRAPMSELPSHVWEAT